MWYKNAYDTEIYRFYLKRFARQYVEIQVLSDSYEVCEAFNVWRYMWYQKQRNNTEHISYTTIDKNKCMI
jgi:hypothetical protein